MTHKSIVAVDIIWEFRISKLIQILIEVTSGNLIPTDVSKKKKTKKKQIQPKADGCFCLNVI